MSDLYPLPASFLHWLDRYLGTWSNGQRNYFVSRRADGWLCASDSAGNSEPLCGVLLHTKKVAPPEGPLGARPVVLSDNLMRHWLSADELTRFRGALNVSVGRNKVLALIENRILESHPIAVEHSREADWSLGAIDLACLPYDDQEILNKLFLKFRRKRLPKNAAKCRYVPAETRVSRIVIPKHRPRSTKFVGTLGWEWGPDHRRYDQLYLSQDRARKHWLLWLEWEEEDMDTRVGAYMAKGNLSAPEASIALVGCYYAGEENEFNYNGRPTDVFQNGILSAPQWLQTIDSLWPNINSTDPSIPRIN